MSLNPAQRNKIDVSKLSDEEQKAFRMYGKIPDRKNILQNKLKERKFFDSGDYALSKAGKTSDTGITDVGAKHATPEDIPHSHTSVPQNTAPTSSSPVKSESGLMSDALDR